MMLIAYGFGLCIAALVRIAAMLKTWKRFHGMMKDMQEDLQSNYRPMFLADSLSNELDFATGNTRKHKKAEKVEHE